MNVAFSYCAFKCGAGALARLPLAVNRISEAFPGLNPQLAVEEYFRFWHLAGEGARYTPHTNTPNTYPLNYFSSGFSHSHRYSSGFCTNFALTGFCRIYSHFSFKLSSDRST